MHPVQQLFDSVSLESASLPVVLRELCTIAGLENTPLDALRASRIDPETDGRSQDTSSGVPREDFIADSNVESLDAFISINVLMHKMYRILLMKSMLRALEVTSGPVGRKAGE